LRYGHADTTPAFSFSIHQFTPFAHNQKARLTVSSFFEAQLPNREMRGAVENRFFFWHADAPRHAK